MIEPGLQSHLVAAAIVGTRVFPGRMPDSVRYPAVTYELVGGDADYVHGGPTGLAEGRYQLTGWAERYAGAKAVAEAVRVALEGFRGLWAGHPVASVRLVGAERDFYDPAAAAWAVQADYLIQFTR